MDEWPPSLTAGLATVSVIGMLWLGRRLFQRIRHRVANAVANASPMNPVCTAPAEPTSAPPTLPEGTLPVLLAPALFERTQTLGALARARAASGLNAGTWEGHLLPVFERTAELVQLLPGSESHHHAHPGGLWSHLCETVEFSLRLRQGVMLPSGRDADDMSKHKHRWTAGVAIAALLHDIGKPVSDVRVRLYGPHHRGTPWNAMAGSMCEAGAIAYTVDFPPEHERDYGAHQKLGAMLLQRLIPPKTLSWLGEDGRLIDALLAYLSGETTPDRNAIAELVKRAEAQSVRTNLMSGPRTRFACARAVPLIERLMDALRRMLAEGGQLPLNRPGAAGYVFEGEVWFAAARLANSVRDYLAQHESGAAIPGPDKNDRLFDVWQDYGACVPNPATGLALWGGRIVFDPAIGNPGYELPAMLRFPLALLYRNPAHYPGPMPGRIECLATGSPLPPTGEASVPVPVSDPDPVPSLPGVHTVNTPDASPSPPGVYPVNTPEASQPRPTDRFTDPPSVHPVNTSDGSKPRPADRLAGPAPEHSPASTRAHGAQAASKLSQLTNATPKLPPKAQRPAKPAGHAHADGAPTDDAAMPAPAPEPRPKLATEAGQDTPAGAAAVFLGADDMASSAELMRAKSSTKRQSKVDEPMKTLAPVAPAITLPKGTTARPAKGENPGAVEFMAWVQRGVADGTLPYNSTGAMVHFVKYGTETGLLLVSPSIFRVYAGQAQELAVKDSDAPGQATQRALSNSGWQLRGPAGKNIWSYQVMRKGDKGGNLLNGFLILEPARFFDPVPPANDRLVLWNTAPAPSPRGELSPRNERTNHVSP